MKQSRTKNGGSLRTRAEGLLAKQKERLRELSETDLKKLVHELGTHQIELELQNEELRAAQVELESSRAKYADLYDFAPVGYFTFDRDGLIKDVNLTGAGMLGIPRQLLLNKPIIPFVEAAHRPVFRDHLRDVFATPSSASCEISLLKKDGAAFTARLNSLSLAADDGEISVCRTSMSDVTNRARIEQALAESEQRYHSLFENMLDGFAYCGLIFDDDGKPADLVYLDVNSAFGRLTGLQSVVGKKLSAVLPGTREAHPELLEMAGRVAATGRSEKFEVEFKPLGMWLSASMYSTKRDYVTIIFDDITERKRAENALRDSNRDLTRFNIAAVGRELRMVDLKKEINELCLQAGKPPRYPLDGEEEQQ
ncbi:MAG TPA: PAS domain S-box protein [Nitrospirota bacterium]